MVISFPRTTMTESNAASTSLSSSSRCPRRATIDWSPGTRIFTWVVALAKVRSSEGGPPFLPVGGLLVVRCKRGRHPTTPAEGDCTVRLPGRPRHLPPSQTVEMEVVHRLPGVVAGIGHETPSGAVHALDPGELYRRLDHLHEHVGVTIADLLHGPKVLLRHDQDVRGCLGIDVPKGHHVVGLAHDPSGRFSGDDAAEQAVGVHGPNSTPVAYGGRLRVGPRGGSPP